MKQPSHNAKNLHLYFVISLIMCIFAADIILINMKRIISIMCATLWTGFAAAQIQTNAGVQYLQCMQKDMSTDFYDLSNTYFFADSLVSFNAAKGEGQVQWKRYRMSPRQAFNLNGYWPVKMQQLDFLMLPTTTTQT